MNQRSEAERRMAQWHVQSPSTPGFHEVIIPGREDCRVVHVFRLNLPAGQVYQLSSGHLEMNAVLIAGQARARGVGVRSGNGGGQHIGIFGSTGQLGRTSPISLSRYDSIYIPGAHTVEIAAVEDCIFYIGGAPFEGTGVPFFRRFNPELPLGDVHQIHGHGAGQREVHFTLNAEVPASRLICGLTWGGNGSWTSWPPHQHENDLEEVYCYFDMDEPNIGFHISFLKPENIDAAVAHPVRSGSMVLAPLGYHPTVASPGTRNAYFWILAAHSSPSRRYDLAEIAPEYAAT